MAEIKSLTASEMNETMDSWLYGYGFSYVYYREVAIVIPYNDINWQEDYMFVTELRKSKHVQLVYDNTGICLHTLHVKATSNCQVTRDIPNDELLDLDVGKLSPLLNEYLDSFPRIRKK